MKKLPPARVLSPLAALARGVLVALVAVAGFGVLGSASCIYRVDDDDEFCDDDDFDDDDIGDDDNESCGDDDDGVIVIFGSSAEAYRLEEVDLEPGGSPGAHPVRLVTGIEGPSIFELLGPGEYGGEDFRRLSDRYLEANDDLLGLPVAAGRRRFAGTRFVPGGVVVVYAQEVLRDGRWRDLPGAGTRLAYDAFGRLVSVANEVRLPPFPADALDPTAGGGPAAGTGRGPHGG